MAGCATGFIERFAIFSIAIDSLIIIDVGLQILQLLDESHQSVQLAIAEGRGEVVVFILEGSQQFVGTLVLGGKDTGESSLVRTRTVASIHAKVIPAMAFLATPG